MRLLFFHMCVKYYLLTYWPDFLSQQSTRIWKRCLNFWRYTIRMCFESSCMIYIVWYWIYAAISLFNKSRLSNLKKLRRKLTFIFHFSVLIYYYLWFKVNKIVMITSCFNIVHSQSHFFLDFSDIWYPTLGPRMC